MKTWWKRYWMFCVSFGLALAVFGGMFWVGYRWIMTEQETDVLQSPTEIPKPYQPTEEDSKLFLVILCPEQHLSAECFVLMRLDAPEKQLTILPLPKTLVLHFSQKTMTLAEHYDYGSTRYAADAVQTWLGCPIDYTLRLDAKGVKTLVDLYGGITYPIPQTMTVWDTLYPAGVNRLDGVRIYELLREMPSWQGDLIAAFVDQVCTDQIKRQPDRWITALFESADTDLSRMELQQHQKAIYAFYEELPPKTSVLTLEGETQWSAEGELFYADPAQAAALAREWRRMGE